MSQRNKKNLDEEELFDEDLNEEEDEVEEVFLEDSDEANITDEDLCEKNLSPKRIKDFIDQSEEIIKERDDFIKEVDAETFNIIKKNNDCLKKKLF